MFFRARQARAPGPCTHCSVARRLAVAPGASSHNFLIKHFFFPQKNRGCFGFLFCFACSTTQAFPLGKEKGCILQVFGCFLKSDEKKKQIEFFPGVMPCEDDGCVGVAQPRRSPQGWERVPPCVATRPEASPAPTSAVEGSHGRGRALTRRSWRPMMAGQG